MKEQVLEVIQYFAVFMGIILATVILAYLVNRFFRRLIRLRSTQMNTDPTNYQFMRHMMTGLVYIIGFSVAVYSIPPLRVIAGSMLAGAGILAVAVGFASQQALSNVISGFFIVIFKPFRVHDRVKLREMVGIIEDITLRHTVIRDFENQRIIIPNSVISDEIITNADFGEDNVCRFINVSISYDSDVKLAKKIIAEAIENHPFFIDKRSAEQIANNDPKVPVRVILLGDFSINLRGWAWAKNSAEGFALNCDVNEILLEKFAEVGIEIPFPHQTVVLKNAKKQQDKTEV